MWATGVKRFGVCSSSSLFSLVFAEVFRTASALALKSVWRLPGA
jgi:hypothetical protein